MRLHDEIKKNYERGDYDQQIKTTANYSHPDPLGWYQRITKGIFPIWLVLLLATFVPAGYSLAHCLGWLHYFFMALLVLNTIGLVYCHFKIKQLKNNPQPK